MTRTTTSDTATVTLPDTEYGLAVDGNGTRIESVSMTVQDRAERVFLVAADADGNAALVALDAKECREVGAWLIAAGKRMGGAS